MAAGRYGRGQTPVPAPACVLWFYDTTRNGTRRWCFMAICGNRAKAHRHYDRVKKTR